MPQMIRTVSTLVCAILLPVAYKPLFWLKYSGLHTMLSSNEGMFRCFAEQTCGSYYLYSL